MPRVDRAQRFLLNPHAFMDDPAVQRMSLKARGAYAMLWLAGWDQKVPGVYLNDDRVLAQLARCTPQEWSEVRAEVLSAFSVPDSVTSSVTERDTLVLSVFSVTLASQNQKRDMDRERQRRKRLRERDSHAVSQRDSLDGSGSGSGSKRSDSEKPLTLNPILPARPAIQPASKPESTPVAQRPVNRTNPAPIDPDALERATCHKCRNKFARPIGSQRTLCPPCHDPG